MSILQGIAVLLGLSPDAIRAAFQAAIDASPESAALLSGLVARFDEAIGPESLAEFASALPGELKELALFHFNGRKRPSDLA